MGAPLVRKIKNNFNAIYKLIKKFIEVTKELPDDASNYISENISFESYINTYFFKKKYPISKNELALVCPWGIGDTLMVAGLAHAILKKGIAKKIVLLIKPEHEFIASIFPSISRYYFLDETSDYIDRRNNNLKLSNQQLKAGQYFFAHFQNWDLLEFVGKNNITLIDCYKALFRLHDLTPIEKTDSLSDSAFIYCKELMKKHNLEQDKCIILAPNATSIELVSNEFWKQLIDKLLLIGYKIVLNTKDESWFVKDRVIPIDVPLNQMVPFSILIGKVIALRSGLCDLLSIYNIDLTIIYPRIKWYSGYLKDGTSVAKMGLSNSVKEYEISAWNSLDSSRNIEPNSLDFRHTGTLNDEEDLSYSNVIRKISNDCIN